MTRPGYDHCSMNGPRYAACSLQHAAPLAVSIFLYVSVSWDHALGILSSVAMPQSRSTLLLPGAGAGAGAPSSATFCSCRW